MAVLVALSACSFDPTGAFGAGGSDAHIANPVADAAPTPLPDAREPSVDAAPALRIAYNVGGSALTGVDFPGVWEAGPSVCDGALWNVAGDIAGTVDDALFRDYAYSNVGPVRCALGVGLPPGAYEVTLVFAEVWYGTGCDGGGGVGARVFDIAIEGDVRETAIDTAVAGGCCAPGATEPGTPFARTFVAEVTDGVLNVDLVPASDGTAAMVSAISLQAIPAP